MIKNIYYLIISIFILSVSTVQAQVFQWAKSIKSAGFDEGFDLTTDPNGYVYVGGQIEFDADFGNGVILHSAGRHDIFIAKYDPSGNLVWAKRAGGKGGDKVQSIVLDGTGYIYVAGEFEDTSYWDGIMKATPGLGINNMFVAKYDTSGSVIWVRNLSAGSGPLHTRGYGITCDAQGNVYACGGMNGDAYYNGTFLFSTAGDYDGTVIKFDPNGNFCWARRLGGTDSDKAYGIVSDNNGSIYVTGYFSGQAHFSSTVSLAGAGHTDIFLAKYDTAGSLQWVKQAGDTGFDRGWNITINVNNQIVITGEFQTGYFGSNLVHSQGNEDMFLASYDSNGNNIWAIDGGGVEDDIGRGVSHDSLGNIFVIGDYANTGYFPPYTISSNGFADIFIAKYNSAGTSLDWIRSIGGLDNDRGRGIGIDPAGNIYACGEFVDSMHLDSLNLTGDSLLDIYVTKIVPGSLCSAQISTLIQSTCHGSCNGSAIASTTGQGQLNITWSTVPVQYGTTATNLCAGTYSVTSIDANGCSASTTFTLTDPPMIQLTTTFSDPVCNGSCNGTANVSATGRSPFTFDWLTVPPQTTASITGLCSGTYSVITTDIAGCTSTDSVTLTDPLPLQITSNIINTSCIGCSDGTIYLQVTGGTIPYQYSWSDGSHTQNIFNLSAGNYSACVTDLNNCILCDTFNVLNPSTGVSDFDNSPGFSVFPNPFRTSAKVILNLPGSGTTNLVIYNSTGQTVYKTEFNGNEFQLNNNSLKSGIYFLQLNNKLISSNRIIPLVIEE